MVKHDIPSLTVVEFNIIYVLAKSDHALNPYTIHKEMLRINYDFFEAMIHGGLKFQTMDWQALSASFVSLRDILSFVAKISEDRGRAEEDAKKMNKLLEGGDLKSMRECEKIMRGYLETQTPTVERISRNLKNLENESWVTKRDIGKKETVWAIASSDLRKSVLVYSEKTMKNKEDELIRIVKPVMEIFRKEFKQKSLS